MNITDEELAQPNPPAPTTNSSRQSSDGDGGGGSREESSKHIRTPLMKSLLNQTHPLLLLIVADRVVMVMVVGAAGKRAVSTYEDPIFSREIPSGKQKI